MPRVTYSILERRPTPHARCPDEREAGSTADCTQGSDRSARAPIIRYLDAPHTDRRSCTRSAAEIRRRVTFVHPKSGKLRARHEACLEPAHTDDADLCGMRARAREKADARG